MQSHVGYSQTHPDARLLIAEDDLDMLSIYTLELSMAGIPAHLVQSSAEALEKVKERAAKGDCYDLIISDLLFKGEELSGVGLAEQIRAIPCNTAIIFLTSRHEQNINIPCALLNVLDVWHKPEDLPDLTKNIMAFFKQKKGEAAKSVASPEAIPLQRTPAPRDWQQRILSFMPVFLMLLVLSVGMNGFMLYRSVYTVGAMRDIQRYVVEKSATTNVMPGLHRVTVPDIVAGYSKLKDGRARIVLEFSPADSKVAEDLAAKREEPLWVSVTREK